MLRICLWRTESLFQKGSSRVFRPMSHEPEALALRDGDRVKPAEVVMNGRDLHHRLARTRRLLVVAAQPPRSPRPGEGPLPHPSAPHRAEPPPPELAARQ